MRKAGTLSGIHMDDDFSRIRILVTIVSKFHHLSHFVSHILIVQDCFVRLHCVLPIVVNWVC